MIEGPIRKLKRRVRELEAKLSDARSEIESLRQNLRQAQIGRIVTNQVPTVFVDEDYRVLLEDSKEGDED